MGGPSKRGRYGKLNKGDEETYMDSREESLLGPIVVEKGEIYRRRN